MEIRQIILRQRTRSAFTLIELMIVLAIAAIVLAIGIPGLQMLVQSQRMTAVVNDLHSAIRLTRSEAIKRGRCVGLAPVSDENHWEDGWMIFTDKKNSCSVKSQDETIFLHPPVPGGIKITSKFGSDKVESVTYLGTGRPKELGSFFFRQDGKLKKMIRINLLGRPRVCDPDPLKDSSDCQL